MYPIISIQPPQMRVLGVVSKFFKTLFRMGSAPGPTQSFVTISKVLELFEYGQKHGFHGMTLSEDEVKGPQRLMDWQANAKDWTILVANNAFDVGNKIVIPPHIKWSDNPHFRYIGIVNDNLEYRTSDNGGSAWFLAHKTSYPEVVEQIDAFFKFWYLRLQLQQSGQQITEVAAGIETVTRSSPIRGFKVVSLIYPNHIASDAEPFTARELAMLLSRSMDIDWFAPTPEFEHFAVSEVRIGNSGNDDAHGFDFGPVDQDNDDFVDRNTVIVRETAGGGMMLLVEETAEKYSAQIKILYECLPDTGNRLQNKEHLEDE
jgi:hypothetical protein